MSIKRIQLSYVHRYHKLLFAVTIRIHLAWPEEIVYYAFAASFRFSWWWFWCALLNVRSIILISLSCYSVLPLTAFSYISSHSINDTKFKRTHSPVSSTQSTVEHWIGLHNPFWVRTIYVKWAIWSSCIERIVNGWCVFMFQLLTWWILNPDETEIENVAENEYHWWYLYWLQVGFWQWDRKIRQWRKIVLCCCMSTMYIVRI